MVKKFLHKHLAVFIAGFLHAWKGTLAAALFCGGFAEFVCVPFGEGYVAVGMFAAALVMIALAVLLFYNCGQDVKKGKYTL